MGFMNRLIRLSACAQRKREREREREKSSSDARLSSGTQREIETRNGNVRGDAMRMKIRVKSATGKTERNEFALAGRFEKTGIRLRLRTRSEGERVRIILSRERSAAERSSAIRGDVGLFLRRSISLSVRDRNATGVHELKENRKKIERKRGRVLTLRNEIRTRSGDSAGIPRIATTNIAWSDKNGSRPSTFIDKTAESDTRVR